MNHIKIVIRPRPNITESSKNINNSFKTSNITINKPNKSIEIKRDNKSTVLYEFDEVLDENDPQDEVFQSCDLIDQVVKGIDSCVIAYGQTGSGKTYSLFGKQLFNSRSIIPRNQSASGDSIRSSSFNNNQITDLSSNIEDSQSNKIDNKIDNQIDSLIDKQIDSKPSSVNSTITDFQIDRTISENDGLIVRSIYKLFNELDKLTKDNKNKTSYTINCEMLQIYNDKVFDLLLDRNRNHPLVLRETLTGVIVKCLSTYRVFSADDAISLIYRANKYRAVRSTELNNESTRSHTIVQLTVCIEEEKSESIRSIRRSILSFVDLSGSEKWTSSMYSKDTGNSSSVKSQSREQSHINSSLHVLGKCISALTNESSSHIPYRDSQLTRLLQRSLSNGRTIILSTIRINERDVEETVNTLLFASRARHVVVKVTEQVNSLYDSNISPIQRIHQLNKLVDELKKQIEVKSNFESMYNSINQDFNSQSLIITQLQLQILALTDELKLLKSKEFIDNNTQTEFIDVDNIFNNESENKVLSQIDIKLDSNIDVNYNSLEKSSADKYFNLLDVKKETYIDGIVNKEIEYNLKSNIDDNVDSKTDSAVVESSYNQSKQLSTINLPNYLPDQIASEITNSSSCSKHNIANCILCNLRSNSYLSISPANKSTSYLPKLSNQINDKYTIIKLDNEIDRTIEKDICTKHGLSNCLLCTLRSNKQITTYSTSNDISSPLSITLSNSLFNQSKSLISPLDNQLNNSLLSSSVNIDKYINDNQIIKTKNKRKIIKKLKPLIK